MGVLSHSNQDIYNNLRVETSSPEVLWIGEVSCEGSVVVGVASMVFVSEGIGTCVEATSLDSTSLVLVDMNEYTVSVV